MRHFITKRYIILSPQDQCWDLDPAIGPVLFPEERFQGNLAPELAMSAQRLNTPQLRARIVDASRFNPGTIMPTYYKAEHLKRVASKWVGQPILNEQEIEDVVAFLVSLNAKP